MSNEAVEKLVELDQQLKRELAAPGENTAAFLEEALRRLRSTKALQRNGSLAICPQLLVADVIEFQLSATRGHLIKARAS